jgi:hypothetical protein
MRKRSWRNQVLVVRVVKVVADLHRVILVLEETGQAPIRVVLRAVIVVLGRRASKQEEEVLLAPPPTYWEDICNNSAKIKISTN